jgi:hypothetical protein
VCNDASTQGPPRIAADGLGNAYVTWHDPRAGGFDIYVQKLATGGVAAGWPANGRLVCNAPNSQINPALIADANGALITWSDVTRPERGRLRAACARERNRRSRLDRERRDPRGAVQQQAFPQLVSDGAGGAIVVWEDGRNGGALTAQLDIYAGHMKSTGAADSTWGNNGALVCLHPASTRARPSPSPSPGGGAIFTWLDRRNGNGDIYARRILGDGTFPAGWPADGNAVVATVGEQIAPSRSPTARRRDRGVAGRAGHLVVPDQHRRVRRAPSHQRHARRRLGRERQRPLESSPTARTRPRSAATARAEPCRWTDGPSRRRDLRATRARRRHVVSADGRPTGCPCAPRTIHRSRRRS